MNKGEKLLKRTALALSHAMCAAVAWKACSLRWAGRYAGGSAPVWVAFLYAIPFGAAIAACLAAAQYLRKGK